MSEYADRAPGGYETHDLRTRIAAVLRRGILDDVLVAVDGVHDIYVGDDTIRLLPLADAVIRELKLEKQTLNREMWAAAPNVCRYVTDWADDDE
jgi:hypothetical protein